MTKKQALLEKKSYLCKDFEQLNVFTQSEDIKEVRERIEQCITSIDKYLMEVGND